MVGFERGMTSNQTRCSSDPTTDASDVTARGGAPPGPHGPGPDPETDAEGGAAWRGAEATGAEEAMGTEATGAEATGAEATMAEGADCHVFDIAFHPETVQKTKVYPFFE